MYVLYMRNRGHSHVQSVINALVKRATCRNMFEWFMKIFVAFFALFAVLHLGKEEIVKLM